MQAHTQQMRQRTRTPPPTPPPIAAAYVGAAESIVLNANFKLACCPTQIANNIPMHIIVSTCRMMIIDMRKC